MEDVEGIERGAFLLVGGGQGDLHLRHLPDGGLLPGAGLGDAPFERVDLLLALGVEPFELLHLLPRCVFGPDGGVDLGGQRLQVARDDRLLALQLGDLLVQLRQAAVALDPLGVGLVDGRPQALLDLVDVV